MTMHHLRSAAAGAALLLTSFVVACGSDSPTETPSNGGGNPPPAVVASVDLTPPTGDLAIGATAKLTATPRDGSGNALSRTVAWASSDAAIASVDASGLVTGRAAGTTTITATSDGKSASAAMTVKQAGVPVASVTIGRALDTLEAWDQATMTATLRDVGGAPLSNRVVRWATSNAAVATIDSVTGVLTGIDRGTVTVTATSEGKVGTATRVIVIKYRSISAGTMHACDIASGGIAWCWGLNGAEGRLGSDQLSSTSMSSTPFRVPGNHRFVQLATFGRHTCGLTAEGKAYCWGYNGWGGLGTASNVSQSPTPLLVAGNATFRSISAGSDHTCAVAIDNVAYCWGNNDWRQLGTGTSTISSVPVAVSGGIAFGTVTAGPGFTCGVSTTGGAYCWGANSIGQTADGKTINYGNVFVSTPQQVVGGHIFKSVALGNQYACGVTTTGEGYCWGSNNGKLGSGPTNDSSTPLAVSGGLTFNKISTGYGHACGITTANALYCWGANGSGQLGVAVSAGSTVPLRAAGALLVSDVAASGIGTGSGTHTCAVSLDRLTVYCFGRNDVGQLGNGTTSVGTTANSTPTIVSGQKPDGV